jgi:hypothetical protein
VKKRSVVILFCLTTSAFVGSAMAGDLENFLLENDISPQTYKLEPRCEPELPSEPDLPCELEFMLDEQNKLPIYAERF